MNIVFVIYVLDPARNFPSVIRTGPGQPGIPEVVTGPNCDWIVIGAEEHIILKGVVYLSHYLAGGL